ncbi:G-protein coupled receptor [Metarhizium robertsii]|uniref:GPCR, family 2-like protein n=2 Tax=Metarhizium robertsii TaxID=568076 RepID=E9EP72_METRA|nr:GPCR, family 2-like protein [Metarhizium robertsii ARSEF 23]EFZ02082.1 GPCR, family 2-like protein [Metarhizium robertsii ARSEF 23]EXU98250.1 G-protein coupled receptor [Metarhizium robertsii]
MVKLSEDQLNAISIIERVCSVPSLLGCVFIIATFCMSSAFHKPINRLVFYASFGNMLANVGTLMSLSYLNNLDSFGCQFQAFLLQLFTPADAFWTLAMAINVYLTFYHKFDAQRLRKMELWYLIGCYGVPFVPAFTYIFARNKLGQRIYGNATLWCWVSTDYDALRVATLYAPVWIAILITFSIYIRAGRTIYEKRKQLHDFHSSDPDPLSVDGEALATVKRTEVMVTSEAVGEPGIALGPLPRRDSSSADDPQSASAAYSVHISANNSTVSDGKPVLAIPGTTIHHASTVQIASHRLSKPARRHIHELNNAAWSYTKCAILFFTALLITWIPSSANRVYSAVHPGDVSVPLQFMSAFVLPLQGFWNAVIYAVTSWGACKNVLHDWKFGWRQAVSQGMGANDATGRNNRRYETQFKSPARAHITWESESVTELARATTNSAEGRGNY